MFAAKSSILCALLWLGVVTADVHTAFNKTEKINGELHSINIRNSLITALTCSESPNADSTRDCLITHTTMDSQSKSVSCEYKLGDTVYAINAYPWTADRAILVSQSMEKDKSGFYLASVINFPDCKKIKTAFSSEKYQAVEEKFEINDAILINDNDTFDVLYIDPKMCGNKACKYTFDAQGSKVGLPVPSFVPLDGEWMYRVVKKLPGSRSFIVIELKPDEAYRISLIKPDEQYVLKEFKTYGDVKDHDVSTSRGLIRLCSNTNTTKVNCELFDHLSGKSTAKISVVAPQTVKTVTVENLSNGEFLLLGENEQSRTLMKVKGDGSIIGVAELSHFACDMAYVSYLEADDHRYCVIRQCSDKGDLKILKECYDDSDFD